MKRALCTSSSTAAFAVVIMSASNAPPMIVLIVDPLHVERISIAVKHIWASQPGLIVASWHARGLLRSAAFRRSTPNMQDQADPKRPTASAPRDCDNSTTSRQEET